MAGGEEGSGTGDEGKGEAGRGRGTVVDEESCLRCLLPLRVFTVTSPYAQSPSSLSSLTSTALLAGRPSLARNVSCEHIALVAIDSVLLDDGALGPVLIVHRRFAPVLPS